MHKMSCFIKGTLVGFAVGAAVGGRNVPAHRLQGLRLRRGVPDGPRRALLRPRGGRRRLYAATGGDHPPAGPFCSAATAPDPQSGHPRPARSVGGDQWWAGDREEPAERKVRRLLRDGS